MAAQDLRLAVEKLTLAVQLFRQPRAAPPAEILLAAGQALDELQKVCEPLPASVLPPRWHHYVRWRDKGIAPFSVTRDTAKAFAQIALDTLREWLSTDPSFTPNGAPQELLDLLTIGSLDELHSERVRDRHR